LGELAGQACSTPRPIQCQTSGSTDEGSTKLDIEGDYITQSVRLMGQSLNCAADRFIVKECQIFPIRVLVRNKAQ